MNWALHTGECHVAYGWVSRCIRVNVTLHTGECHVAYGWVSRCIRVNVMLSATVIDHTCTVWPFVYNPVTKKTFLQDFLEILKWMLHNFKKILSRCSLLLNAREMKQVQIFNYTMLPVSKGLTYHCKLIVRTNNLHFNPLMVRNILLHSHISEHHYACSTE